MIINNSQRRLERYSPSRRLQQREKVYRRTIAHVFNKTIVDSRFRPVATPSKSPSIRPMTSFIKTEVDNV